MKRKVLFVILLLSLFLLPLFARVQNYISLSGVYSYNTNVFSDPMPTYFSETNFKYRQSSPYMKEYSAGLKLDYSLFFSSKGHSGISLSLAVGKPLYRISYTPEGTYADPYYVVSKESDFDYWYGLISIGPSFRWNVGFLDYGVSIRAHIGVMEPISNKNLVFGVEYSPYARFLIGPAYVNIGCSLYSHVVKFVTSSDTKWYEEYFFMLSIMPYIGVGIKI